MKEKVDYNIECAHIYSDEEFGESQTKSIEVAKKIITKIENQGNTFCCGVLIDDYHPTKSTLDEKDLVKKIELSGIKIDYIGYESRTVEAGDYLLKRIPEKMKTVEIFHSPKKEVIVLKKGNKRIGLKDEKEFSIKHTCSLLSAAWCLCKLGLYDHTRIGLKQFTKKPFLGEKIITILPNVFKSSEKKAEEILEEANFENIKEKIITKYY